VHTYLRRERGILKEDADELLSELKKTNRLLQTLIYGGIGFALGVLVMLLRARSYW
jgi:ubiquinone biosynthesis protein